jgi:hypothetical protein
MHYNSSRNDAGGVCDCEDNMGRHPTRRIPKLAFTKTRGIGWHANYRDSQSGMPRKYRFGMVDREKASALYNAWLVEHLKGAPHRSRSEVDGKPAAAKEQAGSADKVLRLSSISVGHPQPNPHPQEHKNPLSSERGLITRNPADGRPRLVSSTRKSKSLQCET